MKTQRNHGFLLLELIIYMGLLSILIMIMSQIFIATLSTKLESESTTSVQQDGSYIMARIPYDIRRAVSIVSPAIGQASSTLTLSIIENGIPKTYQYVWLNNQLTLSDGTSTDLLHSNHASITQFSVTRIGNSASISTAKDTIRINMTIASTIQTSSGIRQLTFQSTTQLR